MDVVNSMFLKIVSAGVSTFGTVHDKIYLRAEIGFRHIVVSAACRKYPISAGIPEQQQNIFLSTYIGDTMSKIFKLFISNESFFKSFRYREYLFPYPQTLFYIIRWTQIFKPFQFICCFG
jgi:hypothetical protein